MVVEARQAHAGGMNEGPAQPPGSTAVQSDTPDPTEPTEPTEPTGQQTREQPSGDARTGIDTENLRDYRALRRDVHDRKIAGVCAGLARHLDIDPTLVRVVMVVLALFGGAGLVLYGALWLFVPEDGAESGLVPVAEGARNVIIIVTLVVAALVAFPAGFDGGAAVPILVVAIILVAVLMSRDAAKRNAPASSGTVPPPAQLTATGCVAPAPQRRRGPLLFGIVVASVALALGVLGLVDANGQPVPDAAYAALALAVIGGWLVVGSVYGRPGGVVLLGLVALVALAATSVVEPTFEGEREVAVRPASAAELDPRYDLPAGRAEIDLRGIRDLESLDGRTLDVELNAGEIVLIVPEGLAVDLDAQVGAGGEISTPDGTRNGWGVEVDELVGGEDSRATLDAELDVAFGRIHVRSQ